MPRFSHAICRSAAGFLLAGATFAQQSLVKVGSQPSKRLKANQTAAPARGITTPGIQIPFSSLKAAAEISAPSPPTWIFASDPVLLLAENGIYRIDPKTNKLDEPVTGIENPCGGIGAGFGSLWIPACKEHALVRLDSKTLIVGAKLPMIGTTTAPGNIATTGDSVWMVVDDKSTLARIDPEQNLVVAELRLPAGCRSLVYGEAALWLACPALNKVVRLNPETNLIEKEIEVSAQPEVLAAGENSVWVYCRKDGKVDRIDPKTNKVSNTIELNVPGAAGTITTGEGSVWVSVEGFPLTRINPATDAVVQQFYGEGGGTVRTSPGAIWLSSRSRGTVLRIDPKLVVLTLPD